MSTTIWSEKYAPKTFDDIILTKETKAAFQEVITSKSVPHMMMVGLPGVGKTTCARIVLRECEYEYKFIKSLDAKIDLLKEDVSRFAKTVSIRGRKIRKAVIIDEIDAVTSHDFLPSLKSLMDELSGLCVFIFTANSLTKFNTEQIEAVLSRCDVYDFNITDRNQYMSMLYTRAREILKSEGIENDKKAVANVIDIHAPDFRKIIGILQMNRHRLMDPEFGSKLEGHKLENIYKAMRENKLEDIQQIVEADLKGCGETIYTEIYDSMRRFFTPKTIPAAIVCTDHYMTGHQGHKDQRIHIAAFIISLRSKIEFK